MAERPTPFPPAWTGLRGWLWRLLPLRVRSAWSPYDNWLRGYIDGCAAGYQRARRHTDEAVRGGPLTDVSESLTQLLDRAPWDDRNESCPHHYGNATYSCSCTVLVSEVRDAIAGRLADLAPSNLGGTDD